MNTIVSIIFFLPLAGLFYTPEAPKVEITPVMVVEPPVVAVEPDLTTKEGLTTFAHQKVAEKWGEGEFDAFNKLIDSESGWSPTAKNPRSSAYGLGQFITKTQRAYGIEGVDEPARQLEATIQYVSDRYGAPTAAWRFKLENNYY